VAREGRAFIDSRTGDMKGKIPRFTLLGAALLVGAGVLMLATGSLFQQAASRAAATTRNRVLTARAYDDLPLPFEANKGQADSDVRFIARGPGYALLLRQGDAELFLSQAGSTAKGGLSKRQTQSGRSNSETSGAALRLRFLGANPQPQVVAQQELPGKVNYFIGRDPAEWRADIPTYARVRYKDVYRGVDLIYYGRQGRLECDFVVYPGSDPSLIRLNAAHSSSAGRLTASRERLRVAPNGDLVVSLAGGEVRLEKPLIYQETGGRRESIPGGFRLIGSGTVGFKLDRYDKSLLLVIDPMLVYSTYLGGTGADVATGIAVDSSGSAYLTGTTQSANFPTASTTPLQSKLAGASNAFVTKFNASGTALVYSTYLGGAGSDQGSAIAVDASGNAYVTGTTTSENFPTTSGAFHTKYGGNGDAFVAKLSADGSKLEYSTYLGGSDADFGRGIAIDPSGNAYVAGQTSSTGFPTQTPYQPSCNVPSGGTCSDAFISELNSTGSSLVYSTYLGGSGSDSAQAIAVDASGSAYVAGFTLSTDFPTASALQKSAAGAGDAFVAKLAPGGSKLAYSTYLGGSGLDRAFGLAVDAAGNAYVTGDTVSADFPVTAGALETLAPGNGDAFVAKLNAAGTALVYSTYLGGGALDEGFAIAVYASGSAAVTGLTESSDFPTVGAFSPALGGGTCGANVCPDAFVASVSANGSSLVYSSYLGGSGADTGQAIALDTSGSVYVAGATASANFPAVTGAVQAAYGGSGSLSEAFVAKVAAADAPVLSASPQSLSFGNQGVNSTSAPLTVTLSDAGSSPLTLSSFTASAGFAVAKGGTCAAGTVLQPGAACTVDVVFNPTTEAAATGTLTVTDSAGGSPHTISLAGTGVAATPAVTLSATTLTFPSMVVGSASTPQTVTVTNSGSASLSITAISVSGNYTQTNTCGSTLAAGAACHVTLVFAPLQTGSDTGTVTITDSATGSPHKVALTGTGVAVFSLAVAPPSAKVVIGATSTTFSVTASAPKSFTSQITVGCKAGATCSASPATIAPGQTSTLTLSGLAGTTPNPFTFTVTGTINSGASNQQVSSTDVTLNFSDVSLSASPAANSIVAGQTASYAVTVTPLNGFNQSVSLSCANTLQAATCSVSPKSVTPNGTSPVNATVTIQTTKQSTRTIPRPTPGGPPRPLQFLNFWLALAILILLACASVIWRGTTGSAGQRWALLALTLSVVVAWSACQDYGYNVIGTGGVSGTQSGNYTVTVSATIGAANSASSVVRSTTVNLSVASSLGQ
jgi:Beta-propeller repeat/Cep192 domain 4